MHVALQLFRNYYINLCSCRNPEPGVIRTRVSVHTLRLPEVVATGVSVCL